MSTSAPHVAMLAAAIRKHNPHAFLLWGGVHCTLRPDEAIGHVDAICIGEGEQTFYEIYNALCGNKDLAPIKGIWYKSGGRVVKNRNRPLSRNDELESMPLSYVGMDCWIYSSTKKRLVPFSFTGYAAYNGLTYRTVWTRGCPFACAYCANSTFSAIDQGYLKIRHPSVEHIIREIESALSIYPFISTVAFYDDNFISVPLPSLEAFSREYSKRIGIPFVVFGMHAEFVTTEKIAMLASAGMNRARMGIQSGSPATLAMYNRKTPLARVAKAVGVLSTATLQYKMIPPSYDIISDNPIEETEDIKKTLNFIYGLARPFTLTVFSLRVFPQTRLWEHFKGHPGYAAIRSDDLYLDTGKSMANVLLYMLATFKPPRRLFDYLLKHIDGPNGSHLQYPVSYKLVKALYFIIRAWSHLKHGDYSVIAGKWTYSIWKLGFVRGKNSEKQG